MSEKQLTSKNGHSSAVIFGSEEEGQAEIQSKSEKYSLKSTNHSSTARSATIYELQKNEVDIKGLLNVHYFKTYELKEKIVKAPLNVRNVKTNPPFDKWSVPYDIVFNF